MSTLDEFQEYIRCGRCFSLKRCYCWETFSILCADCGWIIYEDVNYLNENEIDLYPDIDVS